MHKPIHWLWIMFVLILPSIIPAQEWVVRYNGPGNGNDGARAIALDGAGNVYVTGTSHASGIFNYDYATVKYDAAGVEQWVVRYNGPGNDWDGANAIAVDNVGNIYVTGRSYGSSTDYATVKYDASGVEQWVARYDGPANLQDYAWAIAVDNTGNVYVTGTSFGGSDTLGDDYATIKYDSLGMEQWVARYNGPGYWYDEASAIVLDSMGNVYVTGSSQDSGLDYATVKYNASGVEQWVARYNGYLHYDDDAIAIAVDNVGNVYVTGRAYGLGTGRDYTTIKYDSLGMEQWVVRYNGPYDGYDVATSIALDSAGNVYITGASRDSGTSLDYATVKYDNSGVEQWVVRYNGPVNGSDGAGVIALDDAGNVYVTGGSEGSGTYPDYATVKYDAFGVEQWVARYDGPGNGSDMPYGMALDNAGNIYVTGLSFGLGTEDDYATIKYLSTGITEDRATSVEHGYFGATIFHGHLQLPEDKKCKVFDITGRVVEPTNITRGIYFIEVDGKITQKVVKVR